MCCSTVFWGTTPSEQRVNATLGETIVIEGNVVAGILEHIAKGLRDGTVEARTVTQSQAFLPQHNPVDGHVTGHTPTGKFTLSLEYARKDAP